MPHEIVEAIFIRQITTSDFWNIERSPTTDVGGGSQTYIDIPIRRNMLEPLWRFLGVSPPANPDDKWPSARIFVKTIGAPDHESEIEFADRGGNNNRYLIARQARQRSNSERPYAWSAANGFAQAPDNIASKTDPRIPDVSNLKIYVVKTIEGNYYAGYVNEPVMPADWPPGLALEKLFDHSVSSDVTLFDNAFAFNVPDLVRRILNTWAQGHRNVLLYGPPGTGKTYAMQWLWQLLENPRGLQIDPTNAKSPFSVKTDVYLSTPIRREWVTFHQNYSYEDFIVGLRPLPSTGGALSLKPRVGKLLDLAISLDSNVSQDGKSQAASSVLYIDEINRGNVSRIFGEFITFMEPDYRAGSQIPLPVPLPSVGSDPTDPEKTEDLERTGFADVKLPRPWFFPSNLYVLASMNSVDRAVAPLDSALARRFARIEVAPDMEFLAEYLGIGNVFHLVQLAKRVRPEITSEETEDEEESLAGDSEESSEEEVDSPAASTTPQDTVAITASHVAWLLLYRMNYEIAVTLGPDFELGHTYIMRVAKEADEYGKFTSLARAWDQAIYPQLQERFINRPDELLRILRLDQQTPAGYLFSKRDRPAIFTRSMRVRDIPAVVSLAEASTDHLDRVVLTLKHLAGL